MARSSTCRGLIAAVVYPEALIRSTTRLSRRSSGDLRAIRHATTRIEELSAQLAVITVTYDVTYLGDFSGGFAFTGDNVALRLPAGTWIGARHDGHSQSIELIGAGKTAKGLSSRFEVPYGTTGRFALVVRNGSTSKVIPFRIPG